MKAKKEKHIIEHLVRPKIGYICGMAGVFLLTSAILWGCAHILLNNDIRLELYVLTCAVLICAEVFLFFLYAEKHFRRSSIKLEGELDESKRYLEEVQVQKQQEQLRALQSQINPHFLYNSLDAIRGLALEHGEFEVSDAVGTLSSMFKYTMDFQKMLVSVTSEVSQIERYLKMQNFRFLDRFQLKKVYECEIETLNRLMLPKFTLQPLVENAVVHGLRSRTKDAEIEMRFTHVGNEFLIMVSDNGDGIEEEYVAKMNRIFAGEESADADSQQSGGIALPNVDARIKFYYGEEYGLCLASAKGAGTDVTVRIPYVESI